MYDTFESVIKHFDEAELAYTAYPDDKVVWSVITTENAAFNLHVKVEEETLWVVLHYPLRVPEVLRRTMAELVVRIAPGNNLARLEMDYDEGSLRIRCRLMFDESIGLEPEEIQGPIFTSVISMDWYHPAIVAVLHQGKCPMDAAKQLDAEDDEEAKDNSATDSSLHAKRFELPLPDDEARNN